MEMNFVNNKPLLKGVIWLGSIVFAAAVILSMPKLTISKNIVYETMKGAAVKMHGNPSDCSCFDR
jgi:hypothetical protein